jgi:hypothetical protein
MEGASAAGFGLGSRICVTIEGKLQKTFIRVEQRGQGGRAWCLDSSWGAGGCVLLLLWVWWLWFLMVLAASGTSGAGWS